MSRSEDWLARAAEREAMVETQIIARGVRDLRTIAAMREVPRHLFVPDELARHAYEDRPLPIGHRQTISQPYVVAVMTEALQLTGGETVLEIGAGCGYQTAILSRVAARVFGIEIVDALAAEARHRLGELGFSNVEIRAGDGALGLSEHAPFDAILAAAAAPRVPKRLKEQLKDGGRLVLPVGEILQDLMVVTRRGSAFEERNLFGVQFVPMTGTIRD